MQSSLLEVLRSIPDHRRREGKRFELATVLLYSILAMVAGANSYRQMHEFIRIHRQRLNAAFDLELPYSPSYTGLRLILCAVDPKVLEAAFRRHAASLPTFRMSHEQSPFPATGSQAQYSRNTKPWKCFDLKFLKHTRPPAHPSRS